MKLLSTCLYSFLLTAVLSCPFECFGQKRMGISAEYYIAFESLLGNPFGGPAISVEYCPDWWDDIWRFRGTIGSFSGEASIPAPFPIDDYIVRRRCNFISADTRLHFEHPILDGTSSISVGLFAGNQSFRFLNEDIKQRNEFFTGFRGSLANDLYITNSIALFLEFTLFLSFKGQVVGEEESDEQIRDFYNSNDALRTITISGGIKYEFDLGKK